MRCLLYTYIKNVFSSGQFRWEILPPEQRACLSQDRLRNGQPRTHFWQDDGQRVVFTKAGEGRRPGTPPFGPQSTPGDAAVAAIATTDLVASAFSFSHFPVVVATAALAVIAVAAAAFSSAVFPAASAGRMRVRWRLRRKLARTEIPRAAYLAFWVCAASP